MSGISVSASVAADGTIEAVISDGSRTAVVRFTDADIELSVPDAQPAS